MRNVAHVEHVKDNKCYEGKENNVAGVRMMSNGGLYPQDLKEAYRLASQNFLSRDRKSWPSLATSWQPLSAETPGLRLLSLLGEETREKRNTGSELSSIRC